MSSEETLTTVKKLLLKKLTGEITAPEDERLQKWMDEDESNRRLVERVLSKDFLCRAILDTHKEEKQRSWRRLAEKAGLSRTPRPFSRFRAAAAVVLLLLCGTTYYYYKYVDEPVIEAGSAQAVFHMSGRSIPLEGNTIYFDRLLKETIPNGDKGKEISPDLYARIDVPYGGEYRVVLEDSTRIHLNSGSSLYIPADFSAERRNVSLSGEAYLEVRHDERHPFTIHTERTDIRVLGTILNIEAYEDEPVTTVTLVEGRVELSTGKEQAELPAGHAARIDNDRHILVSRTDLYERTGWHHDRIVFNNRPLEEIMQKLGRWYDIRPAFASDRLRNLRITVDIDKSDTFNQLARLIEKLNEVNIKITRDRVLLSDN